MQAAHPRDLAEPHPTNLTSMLGRGQRYGKTALGRSYPFLMFLSFLANKMECAGILFLFKGGKYYYSWLIVSGHGCARAFQPVTRQNTAVGRHMLQEAAHLRPTRKPAKTSWDSKGISQVTSHVLLKASATLQWCLYSESKTLPNDLSMAFEMQAKHRKQQDRPSP